MLRNVHYFGGTAPKQNITKQKYDKKDDRKKYESGRKWTFLPTWCEGRLWLKYEESDGTMSCKIYQQFAAGNDNLFVKGTNYLRAMTE